MDIDGLLCRILREQWPDCQAYVLSRLPKDVADAARTSVEKTLRCRQPEGGFVRFRCEACGATHTLCFSCKSRFCPVCGKAQAAQAAAKAQARLLNVQHRHLTFSVPEELRPLLYWNRGLLKVVDKAAAQATLKAVGTRCRAHAPVPGIMATVHTYGRDLGFHVHVHVLCTEGGLRADGVWQPVHIFPASQYRKLWQQCLLSQLRAALPKGHRYQRLIGSLYSKHKTGFIVNVMSRYRNGKQAAQYCCRYTGRPPISEQRITGYDGQQVTFTYQDYRDGEHKEVTLPVREFLLRLLQHVWPRYERAVHYYGLYQPSRRKQHEAAVAKASRYGDQVRPKGFLSPKDRLLMALGLKEWHCPECGGNLVVERIEFGKKRHGSKGKAPPDTAGVQLSLPV